MQDLHASIPRPHGLRRPSTLVMLCAGLLAADPLRLLPPAWVGATLPDGLRVAAAAVLLGALLWRLAPRGRRGRSREVHVLVLPPNASRREH
jgi:hypothetical protein